MAIVSEKCPKKREGLNCCQVSTEQEAEKVVTEVRKLGVLTFNAYNVLVFFFISISKMYLAINERI